MNAKIFMLIGIGLSVVCSFLTLFLKKQVKEIFTIAIGAATAVLISMLVSPVMQGNIIEFRRNLFMGVDLYLRADTLSVFFALFSSLVGTVILLYSSGYMKKYENSAEFYFIVLLFMGSMIGLVFSANLILMYVFWELSAVCSWRLIGLHGGKQDTRAANKAFLMTFTSASIMLAGFIMVYMSAGTFNIPELRGVEIKSWVLLLIFIGIMAKSCVFPLHTWLPDAGVAPTPVTALLHAAVLVKIGIYAFARLFCQTFVVPGDVRTDIAILAAISAFIAGSAALKETNIKRILAQSTISQLGLILASLAICTDISLTGALLFILAHALGKAGLFLSAGIIEQKTGTKDINELGGLIKNMPVTATVFAICAMSVAGIPPMLGFWGKLMIITSAIKDGRFVLGVILIICCILTLLYLLRFFTKVFLGSKVSHPQVKEGTPVMLAAISILAILSIIGGLFIQWPVGMVEIAKQQILNIMP